MEANINYSEHTQTMANVRGMLDFIRGKVSDECYFKLHSAIMRTEYASWEEQICIKTLKDIYYELWRTTVA